MAQPALGLGHDPGIAIVGQQGGLLDRFADALLGKIGGYGVPVWLAAGTEQLRGINTQVLKSVSDLGKPDPKTGAAKVPGLRVFPYREVEPDDSFARWPAKGIWKAARTDPPFSGWAVYPEDPLWREAPWTPSGEGDFGLPLELVLNFEIFKQAFDLDAYRSALRERLPPQLYGDCRA